MDRQFTSTCYLISEDKFLLIWHKKFSKWLPPGGHVEPNETPCAAAKREVKEESGFLVEFFDQEEIWIEEKNAKSLLRPFAMLLEQVPSYKEEPAHEHIDFIYVARPTGGKLLDGRWFSIEELETLTQANEIFCDTLKMAKKLLSQNLRVFV